MISASPAPDEVGKHYKFEPDADRLAGEHIDEDYIALTQIPGYAQEAAWRVDAERASFIEKNKLHGLKAWIHA